MGFWNLYRLIRKHIKIILTTLLSATVVAVTILYIYPYYPKKLYKSTFTLMVIPPGQESVPLTEENRSWGSSLSLDERIISNVASLVRSRAVAKKVVQRLGPGAKIANLQQLIEAEPVKAPKEGQELLTNIIQVTVKAPTAESSQLIASVLSEEFIGFYSELNSQEAKEERLIIDGASKKAKEIFQQTKEAVQRYIANNQLTDIDRQSALLTDRLVALSSQLQAAQAGFNKIGPLQMASLKRMIKETKSKISDLSIKQAKLNQLEAKNKVAEDTYTNLNEKLAEARVKEGIKSWGGFVRLIDEADKSSIPVGYYKFSNLLLEWLPPFDYRKVLILTATILFSLLAGIGLVWSLDQLDNTIKSAADVEKVTGLSVSGIVPFIEPTKRIIHNMSGAYAESYNILQTNLIHQLVARKQKIVLVTSARPNEGCSTVTVNLGRALAEAGIATLIIDANFRSASIHSKLSLSRADKGLADVLESNEDVQILAQKTGIKDLEVITSGTKSTNPISLFVSNKIKKLLNKVKENYDVVLIDSPSTVAFADSAALAPFADNILLVVKAGEVIHREVYQYALTHLARASSATISAVLVGASPEYCESYFQYYKHSKALERSKGKYSTLPKEEVLTDGHVSS